MIRLRFAPAMFLLQHQQVAAGLVADLDAQGPGHLDQRQHK
jgi:hypothetical protein